MKFLVRLQGGALMFLALGIVAMAGALLFADILTETPVIRQILWGTGLFSGAVAVVVSLVSMAIRAESGATRTVSFFLLAAALVRVQDILLGSSFRFPEALIWCGTGLILLPAVCLHKEKKLLADLRSEEEG